MSETVRFQTITEALKNAPIPDKLEKSEEPVVIQGPLSIDSGDAILIKGPQCIELDAFSLFLSLGMTAESDLFAGLRCAIPQNVIFLSGRAVRSKFLKNVSMTGSQYDHSRFRLITNDLLHENNRIRLEEEVHQQNILQGLKSMNGQAGVIVFDNAESLMVSDPKAIDKQSIRNFVQTLMEMGVIQIWISPEKNGSKILPEAFFDFTFIVEPEKKAENIAFSVQCERNAYFAQEKLPPIHLKLCRDENGMLILAEKGLIIDDRLVAIWHAVNGKTQSQIGEFLEKDQSTISHWLRKAKDDGLISRDGNDYALTPKGRKTLSTMNHL